MEIISGVFRGHTTGAPITMMIRNSDQRSGDYEEMRTKLRPGHSDYPAMVKYGRHNDHRGGGRFSGRLTATHVMGGAVARKLLKGHNGGGDEFVHGADRRHEDERGVWPGHGRINL